MAAEKKKPVMDVAKPGKSPADATARPIITGHEMIKDPMVTEDKVPLEGVTEEAENTEATETTEEKTAAPSASHKVIQPLSATDEPKEDTEEKPTDDEPRPAGSDTKEESKEAPVTEDAVVDAVLDQVNDKKEETKESEEERKRQELVDKLVEDKKYFVPIGQVQKRRNNRIALLLLGALLPVIVGLGLAADAGAINLGFKVPFDFIKDKPVVTAPVTTTTTTQQAAKPAEPVMKGVADADTAKWTSVTSGKGGFTVRMPDGWQVNNYKPENRIDGDSIIYAGGTAAKVTTVAESPGGDGQIRFEVIQFKNTDDFKLLDGDEQKQDFTSGTLKGTRYYKQHPLKAIDGIGPYPGSESYTYEFKTKDTTTYVIYNIVNYNQFTKTSGITKSDTNQLDLVEKLVKTLQIKQ